MLTVEKLEILERVEKKNPYNFPTPKHLLLNFGMFPTSIFPMHLLFTQL